MKKRRHRAKSDILIDLTSLLDVIFIVLLVVIARQQTLSEKMQDQAKNANEMLEQASDVAREAQAKYELYVDQMEMADNINQYVIVISVNATYNEDNVTQRDVRILCEGDEVKSFALRGTNVQTSMNEFEAALEDYVKHHPDRPVILSLNENDEKILYRDERAIQKIFESLKGKYDNVFVR